MELSLKTTGLFRQNKESTKEIIINRGGTRSSKTYSICQLLLFKLVTEPDKRILIARKTFPALRQSVYRDMIELLTETEVLFQGNHNKAEHTFKYYPTGSEIVFASIDNPHKMRGAEWNYIFLNEADSFTFEDFNQLYLRLSKKSKDGIMNQAFLDFNPSNIFTWIKTELEDTNRAEVIISTYKDNSFLTEDTVRRIEWLRENDEAFWRIYGLGQYATISGLVYTDWETVPAFPEDCKWIAYGLDFGYVNDETALIKIGYYDGALWLEELLYSLALTNQDISAELSRMGMSREDIIFADSAEPKSIEELRRQGWRVKATIKGRDSVLNGIDVVRRYHLKITDKSLNLLNEIRGYKWEDDKATGKLKNVPLAYNNHLLDALRYGVTMKLGTGKKRIRAYG